MRTPFLVLLPKLEREDPNLAELDLSGQSLNTEEVRSLTNIIKNKTFLRSLNLSNMRLDANSIDMLIGALQSNSGLTFLNLEGNKLTASHREQLITIYQKSNLLRELTLDSEEDIADSADAVGICGESSSSHSSASSTTTIAAITMPNIRQANPWFSAIMSDNTKELDRLQKAKIPGRQATDENGFNVWLVAAANNAVQALTWLKKNKVPGMDACCHDKKTKRCISDKNYLLIEIWVAALLEDATESVLWLLKNRISKTQNCWKLATQCGAINSLNILKDKKAPGYKYIINNPEELIISIANHDRRDIFNWWNNDGSLNDRFWIKARGKALKPILVYIIQNNATTVLTALLNKLSTASEDASEASRVYVQWQQLWPEVVASYSDLLNSPEDFYTQAIRSHSNGILNWLLINRHPLPSSGILWTEAIDSGNLPALDILSRAKVPLPEGTTLRHYAIRHLITSHQEPNIDLFALLKYLDQHQIPDNADREEQLSFLAALLREGDNPLVVSAIKWMLARYTNISREDLSDVIEHIVCFSYIYNNRNILSTTGIKYLLDTGAERFVGVKKIDGTSKQQLQIKRQQVMSTRQENRYALLKPETHKIDKKSNAERQQLHNQRQELINAYKANTQILLEPEEHKIERLFQTFYSIHIEHTPSRSSSSQIKLNLQASPNLALLIRALQTNGQILIINPDTKKRRSQNIGLFIKEQLDKIWSSLELPEALPFFHQFYTVIEDYLTNHQQCEETVVSEALSEFDVLWLTTQIKLICILGAKHLEKTLTTSDFCFQNLTSLKEMQLTLYWGEEPNTTIKLRQEETVSQESPLVNALCLERGNKGPQAYFFKKCGQKRKHSPDTNNDKKDGAPAYKKFKHSIYD